MRNMAGDPTKRAARRGATPGFGLPALAPAPVVFALVVLALVVLGLFGCTRTVRKPIRPNPEVSFAALGSLFDGPWAVRADGTVRTDSTDVVAEVPETEADPGSPVTPPPSSGSPAPPTIRSPQTAPSAHPDPNNPILRTIRQLESNSNYQARNASSASGAYQIIDSTWANYAGYPSAYLAPPEIQDTKAAEMITRVLARNDDVSRVPPAWYVGHVPADDSPEWDQVPAPYAGNTITVRQYQQRWIDLYLRITGQSTNGGG
jgi:hypothetical protein